MDEVFVMLQDDVDSGHNMNLEYAHIYLDLYDDTSKALEYSLIEYKKRPDNIDVNRQLAATYLAMNDVKSAKKHIEKALLSNNWSIAGTAEKLGIHRNTLRSKIKEYKLENPD